MNNLGAIASERRAGLRTFDLRQFYLIRDVGDTAWAPDGRTIAFVFNLSGRNNLWLTSAEGGWPRQLTFDNERQVTPAWAPDGRSIAFATDVDGDEQWDLALVSTADGRVRKLTESRDSAEETPTWSPDSRFLAYTVKSKGDSAYEIAVMEVATGSVRRLTVGTPAELAHSNPHWSPDGQFIAYTLGDYTGTINSDIYVHEITTGRRRLLTPHQGKQTFLICDWSPDGRTLLVTSNALNHYDNAALIDVASGRITWLSKEQGETTAGFFSPDGRRVVWTSNVEGNTDIYLYDLATRRARRLPLPPGVNTLGGSRLPGGAQSAFSADGRRLLFYHNGPESPNEAWIYDLERDKASQITHSLPAGVRSEDTVAPRRVHFKSRDGKYVIPALVYVPHNLKRDGTHPAIVYIHGGPNAQNTNSFSRTLQYLINRGYLLIAPDYRGSTGYGQAFHEANTLDLGGGDLEDVLAAADWIEKTGYVDPKKLVLFGGSYGGYLTMMGLVKAPERWAAGAVLFPFVNWFSFSQGTDPAIWQYFAQKMGEAGRNQALWRERSPVNFLDRLRAPLFLLAGGQDTRAPKGETLQVVEALRRRGSPLEWKVYDDEGHGFARLENQLDGYERLVRFLEQYVPPTRRISRLPSDQGQ